jgi:hypothetical protein
LAYKREQKPIGIQTTDGENDHREKMEADSKVKILCRRKQIIGESVLSSEELQEKLQSRGSLWGGTRAAETLTFVYRDYKKIYSNID